MAEDEKGHYEHIVNMYNQFGPEKLSRLEKVFDLHDACKLAAEVEDYETVALFEFVHSRFKQDLHRLEISNIIFAHLDKLAGFWINSVRLTRGGT